MEPKYIPLRVHTAYSLSEGAMKVPALVKQLKKMGIPAFAMTDTANMFGGKAVSKFAADEGIKPILGCQFNLRNPDADNPLKSKGMIIQPDKIVLLVMNEIGYMNIMHLMKVSYLDNPATAENAFITLQNLHDNNEGLIALSGGIEGQIGRLILENRKEESEQTTKELKQIFGNRFYMEISRLGLNSETITEPIFIDLAYKHDIPLVATNEAFFFDESMYEAHDALVCIAEAEMLSNENRRHFSINNRLKSEEEMVQLFSDLPEALQNTVIIAKRCNFLSKKMEPLLPVFNCPDGMTQDEYITQQSYLGLKQRMEKQVYSPNMSDDEKKIIDEKYYARLDYELSVIKKMGFSGYFLIVSDFIRWSKNNGVPVGPGRGSGAGSIVAWSLYITDLDPIKLDLLFERFLNPERVNMPDFDVDFCQENRFKTIEYVQNKYGKDNVAQIITYGKLQSKAVIRDVARVLGMPYPQADKISKMIPMGKQGKNTTLQEALDQVPELEEMRVNDPQINKLFDIAMKLEGLYRNSGVHAAGVVIGDRVLEKLVPLYKDPRADMPVTQYDMKFVEETGLIKFDFLGLKTLTVIKKAVDWIKKVHGVELNMDELPLDDKKTYEMLQRGDTSAVFQFESAGMKDVHRQIKPDRFEDLIAIVSLYRPGPMDNIPTYIKRKHGEEKITYLHQDLAPILDETYGIMVYQEQVMKIAQVLGGYTLGGADKLRKVMGKKMIDEIPKQRAMFTEGAVKKGINQDVATKIFDQMEKFASYGFNKSHAAAYSLISYQTAYLKAHYPVEFMCAVMSLDMTNADKLLLYKEDCKKMGIKVLPANINKSMAEFAVEGNNIRYALAAIKSVGADNMDNIVKERQKNGLFKDISDFINRINAKQINRRQLEQLIKAGAFDDLEKSRGKLMANLDTIISNITAATDMKNSAQSSLFGLDELNSKINLIDAPDWPELEKLQQEADVIGFYLSAHPLDSYRRGMEHLGVENYAKVVRGLKNGDSLHCKFACCVNSFQKRLSQKGNKYAFLGLSDGASNFEAVLFSEGLNKYENIINSGQPLLVEATLTKKEDDNSRMMINTIEMLDRAVADLANGLELHIENIEAVAKLKQVLQKDRNGKNKIYIKPINPNWDIRIALDGGFAFADDIIPQIRSIAGITKIREL